jgi:multidrug efflux pump subunit AcrB
MMRAGLNRRLALLSILLVVGVVTGAILIVIGAEKAVPGSNDNYISVIKPSPTGQSADQTTQQQSQFDSRVKNLTEIANKDERVRALLAGQNYTVVAIAISRAPPSQSAEQPFETASLFLKVSDKFYKIDIDIPHEKIISVEERICYGPGCSD